MNLTNMQLYPNFISQPGLKVIKKFNINSITQFRYAVYGMNSPTDLREPCQTQSPALSPITPDSSSSSPSSLYIWFIVKSNNKHAKVA